MSTRRTRPWYLYGIAIVGAGVVAAGVAEVGAPTSSARTSRQIVTAQTGVVQSTVSGTGNVAAGVDDTVNFKTSGTLAYVYVSKGQHVKQGRLLAALDPTSAQLTLAQAEKNLASAQDQLNTDLSNSSSSGASLRVGPSRPMFVSYKQIASARTTPSKTSTTQTTTTTTTPKTTTPTPTPTTATTPATAAPNTTTSGSSGAGSTTTTSSAASIASAQANVYSAQLSVNNAKTALAETKLYAPTDGTVVSLASLSSGDSVSAGSTGSSSSGSSSGSSGGSSGSSSGSSGATSTTASSGNSSSSSSSGSSSSGFTEIVNASTLTMGVSLSESDISKVKVGQTATVSLDALTGVQLAAHVSSISTVGTTSNSVVSYTATLTLDQTDSRVKAGMSASASVITGQADGVTLPNAAVSGTGSISTVNVLRGGSTVSGQVVVGLKGDSRTQIISGLNAGDQVVVTSTLSSGNSGSATSTAGAGVGAGGRGGGPGGGGPPGGGFAGGPPGGG